MNGLPVDADLSSLEDQSLEQVRFSRHQLQLIFGDRLSVSVEGSCTLTLPGSNPTEIENYSACATMICGLLGLRTRQAVRTETGGLRLVLENSTTLELRVDTQDYESFQVHLGDTTLIA